jgi:hypothetical protein
MTRPAIPWHDRDLFKSFDGDLKRGAGSLDAVVVSPFYAAGFAFCFCHRFYVSSRFAA